MQTQREEVANPFVVYNRIFGQFSTASSAIVDSLQAVFNVTGALTATTALGTTALAIAPPIGVAIACLGTVAFKVYTLVKDNKEFKEILDDLSFVMQKLNKVNPCPSIENQNDTCLYVKRHLIRITEILNLFLVHRESKTERIRSTLAPGTYTNQILREFTLLNAGLSVILLEAKFHTPVDAVAVVEETETEKFLGGGAINYDDPAFVEQVNNLMREINKDTEEIIRQNVSSGGRRRTRQRRSRKNKRTRRKSRR
jgi:hypothetical protein